MWSGLEVTSQLYTTEKEEEAWIIIMGWYHEEGKCFACTFAVKKAPLHRALSVIHGMPQG